MGDLFRSQLSPLWSCPFHISQFDFWNYHWKFVLYCQTENIKFPLWSHNSVSQAVKYQIQWGRQGYRYKVGDWLLMKNIPWPYLGRSCSAQCISLFPLDLFGIEECWEGIRISIIKVLKHWCSRGSKMFSLHVCNLSKFAKSRLMYSEAYFKQIFQLNFV